MGIFEAVESDELAAVEQHLQESPGDVHARGRFQQTPLHLARSREMVRLLLQFGAAVDAVGWMGATPLHWAADRGDAAVVEALLAAGADPRAQPEVGRAPLHRAATAEVVDLLVAAGAGEVDAREGTGMTPLHRAAQFGREGAVRALLRHGAAVDARNDGGETPLHWAASEGHVAVARLLLEAGAPVDAVALAFGQTPLHRAAFRGQVAVVELLLAAGADPDLRDASGQLAYHLARDNRQAAAAAFLLERTSPERLGLAAVVHRTPLPGVAARKFRLHPGGDRAVSLMADGRLACWELAEAPRITHWIQTPHAELRDLAVEPAEGWIAIASEAGEIELRGWEELSVHRRVPLPGGTGATALDFSPGGRFLAVAAGDERLRLVETATGRVRSTVAAPEWVGCVRFSPDGSRLASACSSQGGGEVRLDRVGESGSLRLLHRLSRSRVGTPAADFVDELVHLAFTPDGKGLALFETTWLEEGKPRGWRGNVVMFDAETGDLRWKTPVDGELTGDRRTLAEAGHPHGFFTQLAIVGEEVVCGASAGVLVVLAARTGERVRRVQLATPAAVIGLAFDPQRGTLWALLPEGPVRVPLPADH